MSELIYWTHDNYALFIALFGGYLVGSVPFGLVLSYLAGFGDIRRIGSHNIGATNVLRTGNRLLAALTLLLDGSKGAVAVVLIGHQFPLLTAIGALVGHISPIWLGFQGGKGVATALGLLLILVWPVGVIVGCLWLITAFLYRYASLAALIAFVLSPFVALVFADPYQSITICFMAILIILRHHPNIQRLLRGEEKPLSFTSFHDTSK